jgi:hypothetical protein
VLTALLLDFGKLLGTAGGGDVAGQP